MKKKYVKPTISVATIESTEILAGSYIKYDDKSWDDWGKDDWDKEDDEWKKWHN